MAASKVDRNTEWTTSAVDEECISTFSLKGLMIFYSLLLKKNLPFMTVTFAGSEEHRHKGNQPHNNVSVPIFSTLTSSQRRGITLVSSTMGCSLLGVQPPWQHRQSKSSRKQAVHLPRLHDCLLVQRRGSSLPYSADTLRPATSSRQSNS